MTDVKRMGLLYDPESNKLGSLSDLGEIIERYGSAEIIKLAAKTKSESNNYHGTNVLEDGVDYWIRINGADAARLNHMSSGRVQLASHDESLKNELRTIIQKFLNEHFSSVPEPVVKSIGSKGLAELNLMFNYTARLYGTPKEVGKKVHSQDGIVFYEWGETAETIKYYGYKGDEHLWISLTPQGRVERIFDRKYDDLRAEYRDAVVGLLNKIKKEPAVGFYQSGARKDNDIRYDYKTGKWGSLADVGTKVYGKKDWTIYQWRENDTAPEKKRSYNGSMTDAESKAPTTDFITVRKHDRDVIVIKIDHEDNRLHVFDKPKDEKLKKEATSVLNDALNSSPALKSLDWSSLRYELDELNAFRSENETWGTRREVAKPYHDFKNGASFKTIKKGQNTVYVLFTGKDVPIYSMEISPNKEVIAFNEIRSGIASSTLAKYFLWLFNDIDMIDMDVVVSDRHHYRELGPKERIWDMGLFHDARSDSWKLVQDGKVLKKYDGWQLVNFRNRKFIIDDAKGIIGWIKLNGDRLESWQQNGSYGLDDLAYYLSALSKDDLINVGHIEKYHVTKLREAGYDIREGKLLPFSELMKQGPIMTLIGGWVWHAEAFNSRFDDKDNGLRESYTLKNREGQDRVRVQFADDGYLFSLTATQSEVDPYRERPTLKQLQGPKNFPMALKSALFRLMERLNKKLTPSQAQELGVYSTGGKFIPMSSNADLGAYQKGRIECENDTILVRDRYSPHEWTLAKRGEEEGSYIPYTSKIITIKLDETGLDEITFHSQEAKRNPRLYTPQVLKLIDLFAMVSGQ